MPQESNLSQRQMIDQSFKDVLDAQTAEQIQAVTENLMSPSQTPSAADQFMDQLNTESDYKAAVPTVIADIEKYKKDRDRKLKDSLFETVLAAERQAWIDEHKYPMPSKVRRMVESKIRTAIKKGRLVVDDLGRPRWRGKNVQ